MTEIMETLLFMLAVLAAVAVAAQRLNVAPSILLVVAAHYLLNFDWAIGFVLGAIVAPPDVVAPLAIARRLALPRRLLVVLEGEGLANDATALILYRFAVAAVVSGTFAIEKAAGTFVLIAVGE